MGLLDHLTQQNDEKTIKIACEGSLYIDLDELVPLQQYKELSAVAYEKAKQSILELGFSFPIFIWEHDGRRYVIDAHQRKRVLSKMRDVEGYTIPPLPAVRVFAKDRKEAKKKILAQESQYGDITQEGLYEFIHEEGFELDSEELDTFIAIDEFDFEYHNDDTPAVEDEAPEVSQDPAKSELGKVYQLGRHRLMCGDATKIEDIEKLMNGQKADMVFTDPPYGIDVVSTTMGGSKPFGSVGAEGIVKANIYSPIIGDDTTQTAQDAYNLVSSQGINTIAFWGGNYFTDFLPPSKGWLIWDKKGKDWEDNFSDCEMLWTNKNIPTKLIRFQFMGLVQEGEREERVHPTQKPVGMIAKCFQYLEGSSVLDLFGGSGSTLIACEQTNRQCYMMELDPKYVDVIRKRYAKFIGKEEQWEELTPSLN